MAVLLPGGVAVALVVGVVSAAAVGGDIVIHHLLHCTKTVEDHHQK